MSRGQAYNTPGHETNPGKSAPNPPSRFAPWRDKSVVVFRSVLSVSSVALVKSASVALLVLLASTSVLATRADLARARSLYNQRQFDGAILAALAAQKTPATQDAATVVLARAHLERYRESANPADLTAARTALGTVRVSSLDARDHIDFLMALGEALFFEDDYGAAAQLFESGLDGAIALGPVTAEAMLDWWGSAMERHAEGLARESRAAAFSRMRERMSRELSRHPGSAAAGYWVAVATRGAGDLAGAWDAAIAGWVRARLAANRAANLRADLDKLMLEGIIPDRVRLLAPDQRAQAEADLRADWAVVKERWK